MKRAPFSPEWLANLGAARRGKPRTPETRARIGAAQRGEKGNNWKGGVSGEHQTIRSSAEYAAWRTSVFEKDNYTCQHCGVRGGYLEADHIQQFALYPHLRLELTNGRTLCVPCHEKTPTYGRPRTVRHALEYVRG